MSEGKNCKDTFSLPFKLEDHFRLFFSQLSNIEPRMPAKQKSLFFRKGKDANAGGSSNKGGNSTMAANNGYEKSNFARDSQNR